MATASNLLTPAPAYVKLSTQAVEKSVDEPRERGPSAGRDGQFRVLLRKSPAIHYAIAIKCLRLA